MTLGIISNTPFYDIIYILQNLIYSVYIYEFLSCFLYSYILLLLCANQLAMEYIGYKNLVCCNEYGSVS